MAFAPRGNRGRRPQIPGKGDWQRGGQQQRPQPSLGELYQDAWQSARDANEDRYGQILGGYNQLEDQAGGRLGGLLGGYAGMGSRLGGLAANNLGAINALTNQQREGVLGRAEQRQGDVQGRFGEFGQQQQDLIGRGREQHLGGLGARTGGLLTGRQGAMDRMQQSHQGRTGGMMDILKGAGDTERERIGRQFDQARERQEGEAEQSLINRGLGNTTIRSSVMGGIGDRTEQGRSDAMNRLAEQMRGEQLGAFERGTGAELSQLGRDLEGISMAGERLTGDQMGALDRANIRREGANMQVGMAGLGQLSDAQRDMGQMDFGFGQQGMGGLMNTLGSNLSGQLNLGQSALSALERGGLNTQGIGQDMLNFMERREDEYPDIGQLIELASGAGQSGMGMGGGGMGAPRAYDPFGGLNPFGGGGMYPMPNTSPSGGGGSSNVHVNVGPNVPGGHAGNEYWRRGKPVEGPDGKMYREDPDTGAYVEADPWDTDGDGFPSPGELDDWMNEPPQGPGGGGGGQTTGGGGGGQTTGGGGGGGGGGGVPAPTPTGGKPPITLNDGQVMIWDEGSGTYVPQIDPQMPHINQSASNLNYEKFMEMMNQSGMGMQPGMGGGGGMGIVHDPNRPSGQIG